MKETPTQPINVSRKYVDEHDVTLREYLEMRINNLYVSTNDRFESMEEAVKVALASNEKRLDGMNEFRDALSDQSKTFISKSEHQLTLNATCDDIEKIQEDIKSLRESRAELSGKASQTQFLIVLIISLIGLVASIMRLFIN